MTVLERSCHMEIEALCLAWRPRNAGERLVVGTVTRKDGSFRFRYDGRDLSRAMDAGFNGYPGLVPDPEIEYNGRAMEAFQARLPQPKRPDRARLLGLWGVASDESDPMVLLGATGGRLVTDAFEFLPSLAPAIGTCFMTPVAGFRHCAGSGWLPNIAAGERIECVPEPENEVDARAVRLFWNGVHVGYLRKVVSDSVLRAMESGVRIACSLASEVKGDGPEDVVVEVKYLAGGKPEAESTE